MCLMHSIHYFILRSNIWNNTTWIGTGRRLRLVDHIMGLISNGRRDLWRSHILILSWLIIHTLTLVRHFK